MGWMIRKIAADKILSLRKDVYLYSSVRVWAYQIFVHVSVQNMFRICVVGILLLSLFRSTEAFTQSPVEKVKFSTITAALSNPHVSCILQDSRGFLWIGTEDGLNRFDGYDVTVYRNNTSDTTSLLKNAIIKIYEDSRGLLWVSTGNGGLHVYNREQDNFRRLSQYSFNCEITEFHEDSTSVWLGGVRNHKAFVERIDKANGRRQYYNFFDSCHPVRSLIRISDHEFWVGIHENGLFRWDLKKNTLSRKGPSLKLREVIKGGPRDLWIATDAGLYNYDVYTNKYIVYNTHTIPALPVNNILHLSKERNYLWIGTENGGLCRLNTITNELLTFQANTNDQESFVDNSIHALYSDRQGRVWIGTYSNGIAVMDRLNQKFMGIDIPLKNDVVNAILLDSKKRLWVGTEDGLIVKSAQGVKRYKHTAAKESLGANPVLAVYEDRQHRVWIGTWGGGLDRYDEVHDHFIHYMPDVKRKDALSNPNVFSISQSAKTQELLVATYGGLNILSDVNSGSFKHVYEKRFGFNNYTRKIYQDKKGNIWVGTIEELLRYDPARKEMVRFETTTDYDSIQVGGLCNTMLEDSKGRLWVGTQKGLHLIEEGKFRRRYTIDDGLPDNIVQGIEEDKAGNLWLSTQTGISRFNPAGGAFKNFDAADGLSENNFRPGVCLQDEAGNIFFGGKGICAFNPDSIRSNSFIPEVFITELRIGNQPVKPGNFDGILKRQILETSTITLPSDYNFFSLKYVALNFTATDRNQYAFMLEGFHTDWNYVDGQRTMMFTNLDPGTYTFKVKARNKDGVSNERGATLTIHIQPPWWRTWWAMLIGIVLLITGLMSFYKLRVRSIENRNAILEHQVKRRTEQLEHQNRNLLHSQEELLQSQEEISAQRDIVSAQIVELQEARLIIEKQNREIMIRNETLEAEVEERTRDIVEYNQQLEQFAFISAHNLRAPVARILGLGNVLEMCKSDLQETRMITEKLVFTARELDRVVKDLNTVLEIRRDSTSVIVPVDLQEELHLIKMELEKEIQDTKTTVIENFSKGSTMLAVRPYVHSILMNLVSNAIKYRHPNRRPVIAIHCEVVGNQFSLTIQDNGLGMDLNLYKDKLFMLYSRFHLHVEGKGIGLFLVKTQVSAMGGKIDVMSSPGEGTCFYLSFKLG
jgi:ligand-binding sensor domain-containing protein